MKKNIININLKNIQHNFLQFRNKIIDETTEIYPVLKADGYNIGAITVAKALLDLKEFPEKSFFVFSILEGITLREYFKNNINDIYVLTGPKLNEIELFDKYNLIPIINDEYQLNIIHKYAAKFNKIINIGIQFNTGMNRNGFSMDKINEVSYHINDNKYLNLEIIISHFACADDINSSTTKTQINNCELIKKVFPTIKKSFCATMSSITCTEQQENIVRLGAGLYGLDVHSYYDKYNFKQVLALTSLVEKKDENLIINLGINHGLFKEYQEKGYVIINNEKIKIKQVCDNYSILATNNNFDNYVNKFALITGYYNDIYLNIDEFGKMNNTIGYEMQIRLLNNINNEIFATNIKQELFKNKYQFLHKLKIKQKNSKLISFSTEILELRTITENGFIGYDAINAVKKDDFIITVAGGYADGIMRYLLNNNTYFYIKITNKLTIKAKIIGKISMDQTTLIVENKYKHLFHKNQNIIIFNKENNNILYKKNQREFDCFKNKIKR